MICNTCLRDAASIALRRTIRLKQAIRAPAARTYSHQARYPAVVTVPRPSIAPRQMLTTRGALQPYSTTTASQPATTTADTASSPERPGDMTDGEAAVWDLLQAEFAPTSLVVQDVSGGCGSMYSIDITSEKFRGLNMLKQQRVVNTALADMVKEWHGLQLRTRVP